VRSQEGKKGGGWNEPKKEDYGSIPARESARISHRVGRGGQRGKGKNQLFEASRQWVKEGGMRKKGG